MFFTQSLIHLPIRWAIFAGLLVPFYVMPSLFRCAAAGLTGPVFATLLADAAGLVAVAFLTNNYRLALLLYGISTAIELSLIYFGHHATVALWIGNALPGLACVYFVRRLFVNMGD
jgi:hypothetical protein